LLTTLIFELNLDNVKMKQQR